MFSCSDMILCSMNFFEGGLKKKIKIMRFKFEFELKTVIDMNSFSSGHTCIYFSFSYCPLALVHCLQIHMSYSHRLRYALLTVYLCTITINSLHFILSHSAYSIDSSIHLFFILRPLLSLSLCVSLSLCLSLSLSHSLSLSLCLSHSLSLFVCVSLFLSHSFLLSLSLYLSLYFFSGPASVLDLEICFISRFLLFLYLGSSSSI